MIPEPRPSGLSAAAVALFLVSASALLAEVVLTRIYSVMFWQHSAYLLVALGLLGYGVAGSLLARFGSHGGANASSTAARAATGAACCFPLLLAVAGPLAGECFAGPTGLRHTVVLIVLYAATALPFVAIGLTTATLLSEGRLRFGWLYAADLAGAATGALVAVPALRWIGAPAALGLSGLLSGFAGWALVRGQERPPREARIAAAAGILAPIAGLALLQFVGPPQLPTDPGKQLGEAKKLVEQSIWTEMVRLDLTRPYLGPIYFGGQLSPRMSKRRYLQRMIMQDGYAPTWLYHVDKDVRELDFLPEITQAAAFSWLVRPSMLVIGVGGGIDLLSGLYHGAGAMTGVEMNPITLRLLRDEYAEFLGPPLKDPRISFVHSEGRHFLAQDSSTYDLLMMSGVDTFAAQSVGALSLVEASLYSVESARSMLARLKPGGMLSISRMQRESLRWCSVVREALQRDGCDPRRVGDHFFVLYGGNPGDPFSFWASVLTGREPFPPAALEAFRGFARSRGFDTGFDPGRPPTTTVQRYFAEILSPGSERHDRFVERCDFELRPSTDDWPFFFQLYRPGRALPPTEGVSMLAVNGVIVIVLAALLVLWPVRRGSIVLAASRRMPAVLYFSALGIGFIFVEMVLVSRLVILLGYPSASLAVVLAALLAGAGLGSRLAEGRSSEKGQQLLWVVPLGVLALASVMPPLLLGAVAAPWPVRYGLAAALTFAIGLLLGQPMATGVAALSDAGPGTVAWAWGINGFGSVVGTIASTAVSLFLGFNASLLIACALYAGAAAVLPRLSYRRGAGPAASEAAIFPMPEPDSGSAKDREAPG